MNEKKIHELTKNLSDIWHEYCLAKEELRTELKRSVVPETEKSLQEIIIHIEVLKFNDHEEIGEITEEKWIGNNRLKEPPLEDIDNAIAYLEAMKANFK